MPVCSAKDVIDAFSHMIIGLFLDATWNIRLNSLCTSSPTIVCRLQYTSGPAFENGTKASAEFQSSRYLQIKIEEAGLPKSSRAILVTPTKYIR
jgi:hypothetical protein